MSRSGWKLGKRDPSRIFESANLNRAKKRPARVMYDATRITTRGENQRVVELLRHTWPQRIQRNREREGGGGGGKWTSRIVGDIAVIYESRSLTAGHLWPRSRSSRSIVSSRFLRLRGYYVGFCRPVVAWESVDSRLRRRNNFRICRILELRRPALAARSNVVPRSSRFSASELTSRRSLVARGILLLKLCMRLRFIFTQLGPLARPRYFMTPSLAVNGN